MAPEQTGRMNRSIDFRSDLYSLGITLYQMLTGVLPFIAADPMEWVHCHIARQPVPPEERAKGVPGPISGIIMKLLAKTAEHRYQTAPGLETHLRRSLTRWEAWECVRARRKRFWPRAKRRCASGGASCGGCLARTASSLSTSFRSSSS